MKAKMADAPKKVEAFPVGACRREPDAADAAAARGAYSLPGRPRGASE